MEINLLEERVETTQERSYKTRFGEIKRILEALLFSSSEPLSLQKLREVIETSFPLTPRELRTAIEELGQEYTQEGHAFQIAEIGEGYLLQTVDSMALYVELLHQNKRSERLSQAATEVLAIVAYRQPITRREIEQIRGVDSSGTVISLVERELVAPVGRKEAPGRPIQYGVTKRFLQHFGLKDLQEFTGAVSTSASNGSAPTAP